MARPEISQLVAQGGQLGLGLLQERRMRDIFHLEKDKFQLEQDAMSAGNAVAAAEADFTKKRGAGAQTLGEMRKLAGMDPAVRKTQAPVVFSALEEATGVPLADNVKQFILSAKPEVAGPVIDRIMRGYAQDPTQTLDNLNQMLSNPLASANAIGQISRDLGDAAAQAAITGPQNNPRRNKFLEAKASIDRLISGYQEVIRRYGGTKTAETYQKEVDRLRDSLSKLENVMSAEEAAANGIPVRPGTTVTESGAGNVAVLQGPDDSGSGGTGPGGLKASDERFLKQLAASEFDTEINLQTGDIKFKNRAEADIANRITADAARIFADAGGKLTLSEAYRKAKDKSTAGIQGGLTQTNPYDQF